jgi:hypothetical protein
MRHVALLSLLAPLAACSDYNFSGNAQNQPGETDGGAADGGSEIEIDGEECNGTDDDGDGQIDEGFPDIDGDGFADCTDDDCALETAAAGTVNVPEECASSGGVVVTDPWDVEIEWQYNSGGSGVIVMPAIGNLTDDNGDGRIDEDDDPDIAFTTWGLNTLVALHGDGSGKIFEISGYDGNAGVLIADVDSDGKPEVVASTTADRISAVDGDGTVKWTSSAISGLSTYPQPAVADLDGDGDIEVVFDVGVVNGTTGAVITTLSGVTASWRTTVLADIDQDGTQEIILGNKVFSHTGALEWSDGGTGSGDFSAVADVDGDEGGEVFFVSGSRMNVHDSDGTVLHSVTIPGSNPGPPSVADFDGDGEVEIAIPANTTISVYEVDGTKVWSAAMQDGSGLAGCSGYDIDGDGAYEVLFADETDFRIYDGKTGTVLYTQPNHDSGTLWEYPVTADVDNDGSAEIVFASNSGTWKGVTVLGHGGGGWAKSGPTWGSHDFAVTNIDPDGAVPSPPEPSWLKHNVFRARPTVDEPGLPDLSIALVDVCVASCELGPIRIGYQVSNPGSVDLAAGTSVTLYALLGTREVLVETQVLPAILSGESLASGEFTMSLEEQGTDGFVIRVDDDGTGTGSVDECDEGGNEIVYGDTFCL